jgi:hypothetical protein
MRAAVCRGHPRPLQIDDTPMPRAEPSGLVFARLQQPNDHCKVLITP